MRKIIIKRVFLMDDNVLEAEEITRGVIYHEIMKMATIHNEAAAKGDASFPAFYEFTGFVAGLRFANIFVTWDLEK